MIVTYGLGIDTDVIGGVSAYGFGINILIPLVVIVKFGNIVYREIRSYLIGLEFRGYEVEFENRIFTIEKED